MFLLAVGMEKSYRAQSSTTEIGHYWWSGAGGQALVAIQRTFGHYIDSFSFYSPMAIRNDSEAYRYVAYSQIYPKLKVANMLYRNGFNGELHGITPTQLIPALLTDNRAETTMKVGRHKDLRHLPSKSKGLDNYWNSYKLTLRHHYMTSDIVLWCNYVDMLKRSGKDIRNPKYICPSDLRGEHDRREVELRKQREREATERKRERVMTDEERFRGLKSKFFGICSTDGTTQAHVLGSVQEYIDEGAELHHCLFSNEYHLKENSLILPATIEGKRIETIEVFLDTL